MTSLDKQFNDTKNKHQQEINKLTTERGMLQSQLEKAQFAAQKTEKEMGELKRKVDAAGQSISAHDKTVAQMEKTIAELRREKENLACRLDQGNCKLGNLERQVAQLKHESQHNEGVANDLRGKVQQKEDELESTTSKSDNRLKELNNLMENLKLKLSTLETKHASAQDIAQKQEHENEQLSTKCLVAE